MKSLTKRVLGCVAAITLLMLACDDGDISVLGSGGNGGSGGLGAGSSGSGGSAGIAGTAGQGASGGSAGTAGTVGTGGSAGTAGAAGAGGSGGQGSAGDGGDAGVPDSGTDPDGGGDSGTAARTITDVCSDYCAGRATFAAGSVDAGGGPDCGDQSDQGACNGGCLGQDQAIPPCAAEYKAMIECFFTENNWVCGGGEMNVGGCGGAQTAYGICASSL